MFVIEPVSHAKIGERPFESVLRNIGTLISLVLKAIGISLSLRFFNEKSSLGVAMSSIASSRKAITNNHSTKQWARSGLWRYVCSRLFRERISQTFAGLRRELTILWAFDAPPFGCWIWSLLWTQYRRWQTLALERALCPGARSVDQFSSNLANSSPHSIMPCFRRGRSLNFRWLLGALRDLRSARGST